MGRAVLRPVSLGYVYPLDWLSEYVDDSQRTPPGTLYAFLISLAFGQFRPYAQQVQGIGQIISCLVSESLFQWRSFPLASWDSPNVVPRAVVYNERGAWAEREKPYTPCAAAESGLEVAW